MIEYHCPVCDMESRHADIVVTHCGISYHCCCVQCRDNFSAHPVPYVTMTTAEKDASSWVKRRKIRMQHTPTSSEYSALSSALEPLMGIRSVDVSNRYVRIVYHVLQIRFKQIEAALAEQPCALSSSYFSRIHRSWIVYMEDNEMDALSRVDRACCNKPPVQH